MSAAKRIVCAAHFEKPAELKAVSQETKFLRERDIDLHSHLDRANVECKVYSCLTFVMLSALKYYATEEVKMWL